MQMAYFSLIASIKKVI